MSQTPNQIQSEATHLIRMALMAAGLVDQAKVGYAGECSGEPYDGASADFDSEERNRRVHCYQDEDGTWMIDAMDAEVGIPAPMPYSHGLLIAYLIWGTAKHDGAFTMLAEAGKAG